MSVLHLQHRQYVPRSSNKREINGLSHRGRRINNNKKQQNNNNIIFFVHKTMTPHFKHHQHRHTHSILHCYQTRTAEQSSPQTNVIMSQIFLLKQMLSCHRLSSAHWRRQAHFSSLCFHDDTFFIKKLPRPHLNIQNHKSLSRDFLLAKVLSPLRMISHPVSDREG